MSYAKKIGCYIHIPFCANICSYCDFCKILYKKDIVDKYLDELDKEIVSSYNGEIIDTLYIGGGTPSCLSISQLKKLLSNIRKRLNLAENAECTIECNFESIDYRKIDMLVKYGINRISFGLESINPEKLAVMERKIDKERVKKIIGYLKSKGINNINIDLIYALPGETIAILKEDLNFVKSLDISHISTYSLIIEEHTKLYLNKINNIDQDLDCEMYDLICNELSTYDHYEISNFARNQAYRSKHNLKYWHNEEYYGFGLGASGYEGNVRYEKTRSITKYLLSDYVKDDGIEFLNIKDKIYYEIIMNLRTKDGIDLNDFYNKYKIKLKEIYDYSDLVKKGWLVLTDDKLFIQEHMWYISNSIILKLLEKEVVK